MARGAAAAAALRSDPDWRPVVGLAAEFSPELQRLLLSGDRRALVRDLKGRNAPSETLRTKLKKHLLALGWTIVSKPNVDLVTRLRYLSPAGDKTYASLPLLVETANLDATIPPRTKVDDENEDEDEDENNMQLQLVVRADDDDAIAEYVEVMEESGTGKGRRKNGSTVEQLRVKAKKQLESSGWTFWMTIKYNGCREIRYKAPSGRSYISLLTACKAYVHETAMTSSSNQSAVIDPPTPATTGESKKRRRAPSASSCLDDASKKKKKKKSQAARVLRPRPKDKEGHGPSAAWQRRGRTLLSVLMDSNIIVARDKLAYHRATNGGAPTKQGFVTGEGTIKCSCACNRAFTVAEFAAHAGAAESERRRPWARMFLRDGRSLSQCLRELMAHENHNKNNVSWPRLKQRCHVGAGADDYVCSMCNGCGELVLCDGCPSTFHHACVGLEETPEGEWFCPSCRCAICGSSDVDDPPQPGAPLTDKTVIYCDQCEREFHAGCIRNRGDEEPLPEAEDGSPWLCSTGCSKIFSHLQGLVGRSTPTSMDGVSFVVLRSIISSSSTDTDEDAEQHAKLCAALDVLHECFVTLIEPRTGTDLSADIVFNASSDLRRLNFPGFYTVGLEKAGELIAVATLRVCGDSVAELPLVGTRFAHRRQGMCHLLMDQVEALLRELGVRSLVLPAVPELLPTWTGSFGFTAMTLSDKLEVAAEHSILCFQGTTMCHKLLLPSNAHLHR